MLLRVQQHLGGSLRRNSKQSNGLKTKRGDQGGKLILILHSHEMLRQHHSSKQQRCLSHHYCEIGAKHAQHFGSCRLLNPENLSKHLVGLIVQLQFNEIGKETGEEEFLLSASKYFLKSSVKTFKKKQPIMLMITMQKEGE